MDQKYRGLYFLAATIGVGLLVIGGMKVFSTDNTTQAAPKPAIGVTFSNHHTLENKIKEFSSANFSPKQYNNLLIEINSGEAQNLFNSDIKKMLVEQLNVKYNDLANTRIRMLLQADPLDQVELENLISHLEGTFGPKKEYSEVETNLKALRYYTITIPQKVSFLINEGFAEFNDTKYEFLKAELEKKPNLNPLFGNKRVVVITQRNELKRLHDFQNAYLDWNRDMLK